MRAPEEEAEKEEEAEEEEEKEEEEEEEAAASASGRWSAAGQHQHTVLPTLLHTGAVSFNLHMAKSTIEIHDWKNRRLQVLRGFS